MKLFKYEGYNVVISPEALMLKPFKKIWERDKTESKNKAKTELSFIYFYCDPRSDFTYILDDEERQSEIIKQTGMSSTWTPDKVVKEGMDLYIKLTTTVSSDLLNDAKSSVLNIRKALKAVSFDSIEPSKLPKAIKDAASALSEVPALIKSLQEIEKSMNSEITENSRMRGGAQKTVFEDGLND